MCLNCGCGHFSNTHGDPLNITLGKFRLIALRNQSSMEKQAENIIATLRGVIKAEEPRGDDEIVVKIVRHKVKPKIEVKFVPRPERTYLRKPKTEA